MRPVQKPNQTNPETKETKRTSCCRTVSNGKDYFVSDLGQAVSNRRDVIPPENLEKSVLLSDFSNKGTKFRKGKWSGQHHTVNMQKSSYLNSCPLHRCPLLLTQHSSASRASDNHPSTSLGLIDLGSFIFLLALIMISLEGCNYLHSWRPQNSCVQGISRRKSNENEEIDVKISREEDRKGELYKFQEKLPSRELYRFITQEDRKNWKIWVQVLV